MFQVADSSPLLICETWSKFSVPLASEEAVINSLGGHLLFVSEGFIVLILDDTVATLWNSHGGPYFLHFGKQAGPFTKLVDLGPWEGESVATFTRS